MEQWLVDYYRKCNEKQSLESNKKFDALMNTSDNKEGQNVKLRRLELDKTFELDGIDSLLTNVATDIADKLANEYDRMIFKFIKEGYKCVIEYKKCTDFDIEKGTYTSNKTMLPMKTLPKYGYDKDVILLQPIIDKLEELEIDYKNMTYEECSKLLKERIK